MKAPTILKKGSINTDLSRKYNGERWNLPKLIPDKTVHWDRYAPKVTLNVSKSRTLKKDEKSN